MNGIQAMPKGGDLSIKIYLPQDSSNLLSVEISDTGVGIPEEDLEKIFEPFFTNKEEGTGLGLVICQNIVDLHKGSIQIKNNETGKGVIVTVGFPIPEKITGVANLGS